MGDGGLEVSGGGSTLVATDAMFADAQALRDVQIGLGALRADLRTAAASLRDAGVGHIVHDELDRAVHLAGDVHDRAGFLAGQLGAVMEAYSHAEARAEWLAVNGSAVMAFFTGAAFDVVTGALLGPLRGPAALALPWLVRDRLASDEPQSSDDLAMPEGANRALSNPAVIEAMRLAVSSADEAVLGFGGHPAQLQAALAGAGVTGVSGTAVLLAYWGSFAGLLTDTPVTVERTTTLSAAPTTGFVERLENIPHGHDQIRIDRIENAGEPDRFEVYLGGTADFSPLAADDAFDLTSDVAGVGGLPAGSLRAARAAMADAGVTATSEVTFTGHSQGGLLAAVLASSGDYNTRGVVTIGAPAGGVLLPSGIPAVIIENREDFVPALGGVQTNRDALVVRNSAFDGGPVPADVVAPGHRIEAYLRTAAELDGARSQQLRHAAAQLDAFSAGAERVTSTYYYASRTG